ncbi:MAG: endonuclease domain-containing protein [Solirubrobacterales bacterium]
MAAVLTCGAGATLSHRSAASLWGIAPYGGSRIDIIVCGARRRQRAGIRLHGDALDAADRASRCRIPATALHRTLLDLAGVVDRRRLERAVEEAERLQLLDIAVIDRLLRRSSGRRGVVALRAAIERLRPIPVTRSQLERDFLALCRDQGLPPPAVNRIVAGLEVDALWEGAGLVVELDGYAFHRSRTAFERDRARDAELALGGFMVMRVTARRLRDEPEVVAATIRRLLARA